MWSTLFSGIAGKLVDVFKNLFLGIFLMRQGSKNKELEIIKEQEKTVEKHKKMANNIRSKPVSVVRDSLSKQPKKSTKPKS
jgi:hypothetical protein